MPPVIPRLSGEHNFRDIYKKGRRLKNSVAQLIYLKVATKTTRVAVVVSRKVSTLATRRNLYKRRIWGCLRDNRQLLPTKGYNLVVAVLPAIKNLTYQELNQEIVNLISKTKQINHG